MSSADAIYLISSDAQLERIPQCGYATEDMLQDLIARTPTC